MKLIDRYELEIKWIADYVRCHVIKNGVESVVKAKIVPREDGGGYWLKFPIDPPFALLSIEGSWL